MEWLCVVILHGYVGFDVRYLNNVKTLANGVGDAHIGDR